MSFRLPDVWWVPMAVVVRGIGVMKPRPTAEPILAEFLSTTVASVSDAVDQVAGYRGYMFHDMRPRVPGRIAGRAATALVRLSEDGGGTPCLAVKHSVEMIDNAQPGDVGVIVVENSLDVTAIGGLMGTAAKARGMGGMIIDGGVRDVDELRALGLPVYSRSVVPGSGVGRYVSVASQMPVMCAGTLVSPGDIIVADYDGVVVVPRNREVEVLACAKAIDRRESGMVPYIKTYRSLTKALDRFNRI